MRVHYYILRYILLNMRIWYVLVTLYVARCVFLDHF
jgi:hypothetical protein